MNKEKFNIPNRFENILSNTKFNNYKPLISLVEEDINKFTILKNKADMQGGGVIGFLLGASGTGKTTSVYSTATFKSDEFNNVVSVPNDVQLRYVVSWLRENLQEKNAKSTLVLFDGREITDDSVGLSQLITGLNQLLRSRSDLIFCWPTNDKAWYEQIYKLAKEVGGRNLVPKNCNIEVNGPNKEDWKDILQKLLIQMDLQLSELSISEDLVNKLVEEENTIGEFLGAIGDEISENIIEKQALEALPKLVFIISSGPEVQSEANRIRRARTFNIKAEELLSYSPKSCSGKWWKAKGKDNNNNLGYIISLFDAKLVTISPAAVNYSCYFSQNDELKKIVTDKEIKVNKGNGERAIKATDFYKFLNKEEVNELTSGKKGKNNKETLEAYSIIQSKSSKMHKEINKAICNYTSEFIGDFEKDLTKFEVDAGNGNLFVDSIIKIEEEFYLEFHHLSIGNCKASKMSAYIMEKLKNYAIHYNLIKR